MITLLRLCALRGADALVWVGRAGERVVVADTGDTGFMAVMAVRHQTAQDGRARLELDATDEHLNKAGTGTQRGPPPSSTWPWGRR